MLARNTAPNAIKNCNIVSSYVGKMSESAAHSYLLRASKPQFFCLRLKQKGTGTSEWQDPNFYRAQSPKQANKMVQSPRFLSPLYSVGFAIMYLQVLERLTARRDTHAQTVSPIWCINKKLVINWFCYMYIQTNTGMTQETVKSYVLLWSKRDIV